MPAPNNVYTTQIWASPLEISTPLFIGFPPDGYCWIVTDVDMSVQFPVDAPLLAQFGPVGPPYLFLPAVQIYVPSNIVDYGIQWRGRMFIPADQYFGIEAEFSGGTCFVQVTGYVLKLP